MKRKIRDSTVGESEQKKTKADEISLSSIMDRLDSMEKQITRKLETVEENLRGKLEELDARVDDLEENAQLKSEVECYKTDNDVLRQQVEVVEDCLDKMYRKNNLIFFGLKESSKDDKPRAIKVIFARLSERNAVLANRKHLKNKNISIFISPDLSREDTEKAKKQRENSRKRLQEEKGIRTQ
ncbi:unnamed protein product [Allacma fusca]|uniref:Uncharacterized protein n=1 Tax=Allacma fusca TaxID=39272 RepID=A0A8J2PU82_9HEXA|nr:unnamed protein product [Allacma fusca]